MVGRKVPGYLSSILGATNSTQEPLFQWYKYRSKYPSLDPLSQDLSAQNLPSQGLPSQDLLFLSHLKISNPQISHLKTSHPKISQDPWPQRKFLPFLLSSFWPLLAPSFSNPCHQYAATVSGWLKASGPPGVRECTHGLRLNPWIAGSHRSIH